MIEETKATELASVGEDPVKIEGDPLSPEENALISKMMELGVFYGHSKSRTNPKMRKYIVGNRSGFSVINLRKTVSKLSKAKKLIESVAFKEEAIMIVGTSPSVKGAVKAMSEELELPYVTERWLGGTLTNFDTISKRIKYLKKLKEEQAEGSWDKYTKKEKLDKERELNKLDRLFGGIESLDKVPALVILTDLTNNESASREAKALDIPVLGILNTDSDPNLVTVGIPANDKNVNSVEFLLDQLKEMIVEARKHIPEKKIEVEEKSEEEKKND